MPLNARQQAFVREYRKDSNGSRAARAAGYSEKTAYAIASKLLKKVEVRQALQQKAQQLADKVDVSVERVLQEYARIAFLNPQDFYDSDGALLAIKDMPEDAARVIAGLDEEIIRNGDGLDIGRLKKIKLTGKVPALEGLARHLGMFHDTAPGMQAFQININLNPATDGDER